MADRHGTGSPMPPPLFRWTLGTLSRLPMDARHALASKPATAGRAPPASLECRPLHRETQVKDPTSWLRAVHRGHILTSDRYPPNRTGSATDERTFAAPSG